MDIANRFRPKCCLGRTCGSRDRCRAEVEAVQFTEFGVLNSATTCGRPAAVRPEGLVAHAHDPTRVARFAIPVLGVVESL